MCKARIRRASRVGTGIALLVLAALFVRFAPAAAAQSGGDYDLTWNTVDGGGWTLSTGGDYALGGTIGQPDAGVLEGGDYALTGGFREGAVPYRVYLPLVMRDS